MGAFDDLIPAAQKPAKTAKIPQRSSGAFADLIPSPSYAGVTVDDIVNGTVPEMDLADLYTQYPAQESIPTPIQGGIAPPVAPRAPVQAVPMAPPGPPVRNGILPAIGDRSLNLMSNLISGIGNVSEVGGDYLEGKYPISGIDPEVIRTQDQIRGPFKTVSEKIDDLRKGLNYQPTVDFSQVKEDPFSKNTMTFIKEQGAGMIPDMAGAILAAPSYLMSRTNEIGSQRAQNDDRTDPSMQDLAIAAPVAAVTTLGERFGLHGMLPGGTAGANAATRILKAGAKEGGTEGAEEQLEYAAGTVGTKKGYDVDEGLDATMAGMLVGAPVGSAGRGVVETAEALTRKPSIVETPVAEDNAFADLVPEPVETEAISEAQVEQPDLIREPTKMVEPDNTFSDLVPEAEAVPESAAKNADDTFWTEREQPNDLEKRLDEIEAESKSADEGELKNVLQRVSGVTWGNTINGEVQSIKDALWASENGRPDLAKAIADRDERNAKNKNTVPGVPEGHPKYEAIKARLEADAEQQRDIAKQTRFIADKASAARKEEPGKPTIQKLVTPRGDQEIEASFDVVDADNLITSDKENFPQILQPRDRTRAASDLQINDIANKIDPERLGESRTTDTGAPIVSMDNIVESGNGRVMGIRKAYEQNNEAIQNYRKSLEDRGFDVTGMKNPVLVRRRRTELSPEDRVRFTIASNERTGAALSSTERALADSKIITEDMASRYQGGDITRAENRPFVRSFMDSIAPADRGTMIGPDGTLSQDGTRRLRSALLARAYEDADIIQSLVEDTDTEIKSIGNALTSLAGTVTAFRSSIARGETPKDLDITPNVIEASKIIRDARANNRPMSEVLSQQAMFKEQEINPITERIIRAMYQPSLKRPVSAEKIESFLRKYYDEAAKADAGPNMLGLPDVTPDAILDIATPKQEETTPLEEAADRVKESVAAAKPKETDGVIPDVIKPSKLSAKKAKILAEKAPHVLDLKKKRTGWKKIETQDRTTLINPETGETVVFENDNPKSGTNAARMKARAQAYAIDNPVVREQSEPGELVTKKIFEKPDQKPVARKKRTGTGGDASILPEPQSNLAEIKKQLEDRLAEEAESTGLAGKKTGREFARLVVTAYENLLGKVGDNQAFQQIIEANLGMGLSVQSGTAPKGGRTLDQNSEAFKKWFGKSKVVDKDGKPMVVYHSTSADTDFEKFKNRQGDIGMHFGTIGQANDRADYIRPNRTEKLSGFGLPKPPAAGERVIPVYLSIKNPIRLPDLGSWSFDNIADHLHEKLGAQNVRNAKNLSGLRALMQAYGYDGIVYKNTGEVAGSQAMREAYAPLWEKVKESQKARGKPLNAFDMEDQATPEYKAYSKAREAEERFREANGEDSYIVLDPTQIKSVFNQGTYDPKDPRILYQDLAVDETDVGLQTVLPGAEKISDEEMDRRRIKQMQEQEKLRSKAKQQQMDFGLFDQQKTLFQSAYHGSPYKFDKFTLSHIGSGEGAQAYGWGLYFAGRKEVAEFYREALTNVKVHPRAMPYSNGKKAYRAPNQQVYTDLMGLSKLTNGDMDKMKSILEKNVARYEGSVREKYAPDYLSPDRKKEHINGMKRLLANEKAALKELNKMQAKGYKYDPDTQKAGQLYHVEIPEDDVLLLWDRPLSKQPKAVREALRSIAIDTDEEAMSAFDAALLAALTEDGDTNLPKQPSDPSGEDIYRLIQKNTQAYRRGRTSYVGQEHASKTLNDLGIKGIKYLDGFSRKDGEGSHNYVIFDDEAIEVIKTYYQSDRTDGLRSVLLDAARNLGQAKGSAAQMLAMLRNTAGVKEEEIAWTGLDEFLKSKESVARYEIVDYLEKNQVKIEEVTLGDASTSKKIEVDEAAERILNNKKVSWRSLVEDTVVPIDSLDSLEDDSWYQKEVDAGRAEWATGGTDIEGKPVGETKFSSYTMPGGENYREVLLTLPSNDAAMEAAKQARIEELQNRLSEINARPDTDYNKERDRRNTEMQIRMADKDTEDRTAFRSSHFEQPNILAHVRLNDRTDADGKKVLFIEEIQSDFGQALRKQRQEAEKSLESRWGAILDRMKKDGILEVICP